MHGKSVWRTTRRQVLGPLRYHLLLLDSQLNQSTLQIEHHHSSSCIFKQSWLQSALIPSTVFICQLKPSSSFLSHIYELPNASSNCLNPWLNLCYCLILCEGGWTKEAKDCTSPTECGRLLLDLLRSCRTGLNLLDWNQLEVEFWQLATSFSRALSWILERFCVLTRASSVVCLFTHTLD